MTCLPRLLRRPHNMLVRPPAALLTLACLAALSGCEGGSVGAGDVLVVAQIVVTPPALSLLAGTTEQLEATPKTSSGITIPNRQVTWSSDNSGIATVSADGHVTAVAVGLTVVRATVEGAVGLANVSVNARPAAQLDFQTEPGTGAAGVALTPIRIEVQNDQGGTVTVGTIPVTVSLADNPTGAVLGGALTVNALNGVATFTDLTVNQVGAGYSLRATSGSLNPAVSAPFAIVAGPADALSITTQPSVTGSSGTPLPTQPVVQIRDATGNAVAQAGVQVTAALQGAGAALGGSRTVASNAQGVAVFTNLMLTGAAGTYTLLFAAPGLTAVASTGITLGAGSAATLTIVQQPAATAQSGVILTRQPVLQLEDAEGNPVAQTGLAVTAAIQAGGGVLGGTSTVLTDADGRATFENLSIGGTAGTRTLRFSATSVTPVNSEDVVVEPGLAVALAIATGPPPASTSGAVLAPAPVIQLVDAFGNSADPDAEITIIATIAASSASGGSLGGTTAAATTTGVAHFSNLILSGPAGSYALQFSGGGLTPVVSNPISMGSGAPTALFIVTQPSASAESGTAFAVQPVVQLRDGSGNPVAQAGVDVTAVIQTGDGTLGGTTTRTTNASGRAVFTDLAITGAGGPRTLRFTATGLTGVTSTAIQVSAPVLKISTQPSATAPSGTALAQQPVLELTGGAGSPVSGATVTAVINSGPTGASVSNAAAVTDAGGVATFSGLAITGTAGAYTLRFESGPASAVSGTINITPPATKLLLATPPSSPAQSGIPLATQPRVQLARADGTAAPQAGTTVTAVIASGPSGATLAGATAVSDAAGLAAFSGLTISGPDETYTLRFQSGTLTPVTSGSIELDPGPPATLTIPTQPPTTAENDEELSNNVLVRVQDAAGNNVPGVPVTAGVATGSGIVKGTLTRTTASNGRATFNDLELVGLAGPWTLVFTAPGGPSVVSRTITLFPGDRQVLAIQVQPSTSASSGVNFDTQPTVELRDTGGNLVTSDGEVDVNAVLETVSGVGTLGGTREVQAENGVASFGNLRITGAGTFRIRFTSRGMTSVTSVTIVVTLL